ncbi:hypothetical protein BSKO_05264 [Bryopsis sp. KO-2023]|nr:hypothetical protein BSKO_05264 [Bryopsis sp. KO-2023]
MLVSLAVVAIMLAALGAFAKMFELCEALEEKIEGLRGELKSEALRDELERTRERNRGLMEHIDQIDHVFEMQDRKILYWERSRSEGIRFCNGEIRSEQAKLRSERGKLREARENLDMDTEWISEEKVVLKDQQQALVRKEELLGVVFLAMALRNCGVMDRANIGLFGGGGIRRA